MFYLGVAINGDYIEFLLIDEKCLIHAVQKERHVDLIYDGVFAFRGVIESGIARVCLKANISFEAIGYAYFAVPGYGENDEYDRVLNDVLIQIFKGNQYICENDIEAAMTAALGGEAGITLLAGAGTVAMGMDSRGEKYRSGGWGATAGDEAGEFWLAKKVLEIFTKESDGRYDDHILYQIFKKKLKFQSDLDIINFSFEHIETYGLTFYEFVGIFFDAVRKGDVHALDVLEEAANEFYLLIKSITKYLDIKKPLKISYIGKIFDPSLGLYQLLYEQLKKELTVDFILVKPRLSLVTGAALKAFMFRNKITYNLILQLDIEEKRLHQIIY